MRRRGKTFSSAKPNRQEVRLYSHAPVALAERTTAPEGYNSLRNFNNKIGDILSANAHASILNHATASHPARAENLLLRLQLQYGNRYVQRVLAQGKKPDAKDGATPDVEQTIQQARSGGQALDGQVSAQMSIGQRDTNNEVINRQATIFEYEEQSIQPKSNSVLGSLNRVSNSQPMTIQRTNGGGGGGSTLSQSPYFIHFSHVAPPRPPDHSRANPGPTGTGADRAGYTRVRTRPRMVVRWENFPPVQVNGVQMVPIYVRSANIYFRLDPIEVYVSSLYPVGSCPYRVTHAHEYRHVYAFLSIFRNHRATMVARANGTNLPTSSSPVNVPAANIDAQQNQIIAPVVQAVRDVHRQMGRDMRADRNAKDAPAAYAAEYAKCPASEW